MINLFPDAVQAVMEPFHIKVNEVSEGTSSNHHHTFYYRKSSNGEFRWAWTASSKKPHFLKFYTPTTFKAKMISQVIQCLFYLGLQKLFAHGTCKLELKETRMCRIKLEDEIAIFFGTPGINRTGLIYFPMADHFLKIVLGRETKDLVENERKFLSRLRRNPIKGMVVPNIISSIEKSVRLTNVSKNLTFSNQFGIEHQYVIKKMAETQGFRKPLLATDIWIKIDDQIKKLEAIQDNRMPGGLKNNIEKLYQTISPQSTLETRMAHNDFTPWNVYKTSNKLAVIDWELAQNDFPILHDLFHFVLHPMAIKSTSNTGKALYELNKVLAKPTIKEVIDEYNVDVLLNLKLYLLYISSYYYKKYSLQSNWQYDIPNVLRFWEKLIYELLSPNRSDLIQEIFTFLADKNYATLKWTHQDPMKVSEYSDIDLVTDKKTSRALHKFFKQHPHVKIIRYSKQSFMRSWVLKINDQILSVDAIHTFRRKIYQYMTASEVLSNRIQNDYGIYELLPKYNFQFLFSFYVLNHSRLPIKYRNIFLTYSWPIQDEIIEHISQEYEINTRDISDFLITGDKFESGILVDSLSLQQSEIVTLRNGINYIWDKVKEFIGPSGFVITVSGVDGAGKSTIIKEIGYELEKKYRMNVKFLRHRPGILPMLNTWRVGKEEAEKLVNSRLPRQGNNTNTLSSYLRFSYYLVDYLIGQFIIFVRYTSRGIVVIYDRYYFDFIFDSKRSNIVLPKSFLKWFYRLILKPKYNFFLYAQAETIYKRKQELTIDTIRSISKEYLDYFKQKNRKSSKSLYLPIKNISIKETTDTIIQSLKVA